MIYLLDTSALLAHHRDEPGAEQVQALFENDEHDLLVASISLAEFARRLRDLGATPEEAHAVVRQYLQAIGGVVAVDAGIAMSAFGVICQTPARLPLVDALTAACARSRGACLVHRDRHMSAIPATTLAQLVLETPETA